MNAILSPDKIITDPGQLRQLQKILHQYNNVPPAAHNIIFHVDGGSNSHLVKSEGYFVQFTPCPRNVTVIDGSGAQALGFGTVLGRSKV